MLQIHRGLRLALLAIGGAAGAEPAAAQFRGGWMPEVGILRIQAGVSRSVNDDWFCGDRRSRSGECARGERSEISDTVAREESRTTSFHAGVEITPFRVAALRAPVSFFVELPFHVLRYESFLQAFPEPVNTFTSEGIGDLRIGVRTGRVFGPWSVTTGSALELPTGDFEVNAFLVPVGQGTRNWEFLLEGGRSLHPLYTEVGVLFKLRGSHTAPTGVTVDWGDEVHGRAALGASLGSGFFGKVEGRAFHKEPFTSNVPGDTGEKRTRVSLAGEVLYERGPVSWAVWVDVPVSGRNTPADLTLGLATTVDVTRPPAAGYP